MRIAHNKIANFTGTLELPRREESKLLIRCATTYDHVPAHKLDVINRIRNSTFLWTFVRAPAPRSMSHFFYFRVSRDRFDPTNKGRFFVVPILYSNNVQSNH